jgi:hypothetical protein
MKTYEIRYLTALFLFTYCAIIFEWITRTEALLFMIFVVLMYVLRVLCEICENIKNNHKKT